MPPAARTAGPAPEPASLPASAGRSGGGGRRRLALVASFAPSLVQFRGDLVASICADGHEVLCLAPDFEEGVRRQVRALGAECLDYPLQRTGLDPRADLASRRALEAIFAARRPDIVCGYTPKPAIWASLAAARAGVPRIVPMITGLGYAFLERRGIKGLLAHVAARLLLRRAFARCHGAIFHNADDRALLARLRVLPPGLESHVVSGSGVDLDRFPQAPLPPIGDGVVFLMIARLVRYKGIAEYCAAAAQVRRRGGRARFLLVGPAESGPAGFPASDIGPEVDYLGPRSDIAGLLAAAHVYVLPSHGEGMPRTVLEALSVGRPVITTDARGCRETVQPGRNGYLVPVDNGAALAEAMEGILKRPDLIPAMAEASRRLAEARFDVRIVNRETRAALGL